MIVVGGIYREVCRYPYWDRIFGSGLRAATALSAICPGVQLQSYLSPELAPDVEASLPALGIEGRLRPSRGTVRFDWLHPFERPNIDPEQPLQEAALRLSASEDVVLRFGMLEGEAIVDADRAIYDPQGSPTPFASNGSKAVDLAIVASAEEVLALGGVEIPPPGEPTPVELQRQAVGRLMDDRTSPLRSVLIKDRLGGLVLFEGDDEVSIPTYAAESYFRIGAGDIVSAGFAYAWGQERRSAREAADFAARCLAFAVDGARVPLQHEGVNAMRRITDSTFLPLRILTGDTLELAMLAQEAAAVARLLGISVTIDALPERPHATLVLVGEGQTDELPVELARQSNPPCVVYWPNGSEREVRALFGAAVHARDFASALYRAMRTPSP